MTGETVDVNAVVARNVKAIRERRGMTQLQLAEALSWFTGRVLPQASISSMEGCGGHRRRFDAQELYLLSVVFGVPIVYFFLPPAGVTGELAGTGAAVSQLYVRVLGGEDELGDVKARAEEFRAGSPQVADGVVARLCGATNAVGDGWHGRYRAWRRRRLDELGSAHAGDIEAVASVVSVLAEQVARLGAVTFLKENPG